MKKKTLSDKEKDDRFAERFFYFLGIRIRSDLFRLFAGNQPLGDKLK